MLTTATTKPAGVREKLFAFLQAVVQDSRINRAFQPVIMNLAKNFLAQVDDDQLREGLIKVRDEVIPFFLKDETQNPE